MAIPRGAGGYAEYYVSNEMSAVPLPDFEPKDQILMAQPLGTLVCAARKLGSVLNQTVVIVGQGSIGLLLTRLMSNLGAKHIVACDLLDYRLSVARQMGADVYLETPARITRNAAIEEITHGRMADIVIEVVGHQTQTVNDCLQLARQQGTVLAFGVPDDPVYQFDFHTFFRKNLRFISSVGPDAHIDYALALDMIAQGRIDVSPIITHHLGFDDAQKGL